MNQVGETNKRASFLSLIESEELGDMQKAVLEGFYFYPNSTSQFISETLNIPLATVNGRRNELIDKGLIIETGTTWNESKVGRTTYRAIKKGELSTQKSVDNDCLSIYELRKIENSLLDMRKKVNRTNSFQRVKIINDLELTIKAYKEAIGIGF